MQKYNRSFVFLFFFVIFLPAVSYAEDFSGDWFVNANGWTFNLHINQSGSKITGRMHGVNHNFDSLIKGRIEGRKILFLRENNKLRIPQEYEGFLFDKNGGQTMAGKFSHENQWDYGWYAYRQ